MWIEDINGTLVNLDRMAGITTALLDQDGEKANQLTAYKYGVIAEVDSESYYTLKICGTMYEAMDYKDKIKRELSREGKVIKIDE